MAEMYRVRDSDVVQISNTDLEKIRVDCRISRRRRARICVHRSDADLIHEMLIAILSDSYVRPHCHPFKTESFHVIEGTLDVILFDDNGRVQQVVPMGDVRSSRQFYYRLASPVFHTVLVHTELAIIHETTNGPFDPCETKFASWSPEENDHEAIREYMKDIREQVTR